MPIYNGEADRLFSGASFGSDRAVSGASDIADEERFTSQQRIDSGGGNARRELYYYGARWYLPGVGIFTQPDMDITTLSSTIMPDYRNPQSLNRYAYCLNNPVRYVDPSGHAPEDWDPEWVAEFKNNHPTWTVTEQDWQDRLFSLRHPGSRPNGSWTADSWSAYYEVRGLLGGDLLSQTGDRGRWDIDALSLGTAVIDKRIYGNAEDNLPYFVGPDGTLVIVGDHDRIPREMGAITLGNTILLRRESANLPVLIHEYVHVLQWRRDGAAGFAAQYSWDYLTRGYGDTRYERTAYAVENVYRRPENYWLPAPWDFPR